MTTRLIFNKYMSSRLLLATLLLLCGINFVASAQSSDSIATTKHKIPKNYIKPCVYISYFNTGKRDLRLVNDSVTNRKRDYQFSETNMGFYTPIITNSWLRKDKIHIASFQLLGGVNYAYSTINTSILDQPRILNKLTATIKGIYSDGNKNSFFVAVAPFSSFDQYNKANKSGRLALVAIYNRTVSEKFSYRLGFIKTYVFGKNLGLPIVGFRFGRLDALHINIQLLRNISLNMPVGKHFYFNIYSRAIGSSYNFSNNVDNGHLDKGNLIDFRRSEILFGFQANYNPTTNFSVFASVGGSNGNIQMAESSKSLNFRDDSFQKYRIVRGGFINLGMTFYIGKAKKIAGNYAMYDAIDINNSYGNDDGNNIILNNNQIPAKSNTNNTGSLQYNDIQDLIKDSDF